MIRYLTALFIVSATACHTTVADKNASCMNDSLIVDMPPYRSDSASLKLRDKIERLAGLPKIDTGFNGVCFRIWYGYGDFERLLLVTKQNDKWSGTFNTLKYNYDSAYNKLLTIDRTEQEMLPRSGWKAFTDTLILMGMLDLPDMSAVPECELATDGEWFSVEIAKCRKYRQYSYQVPFSETDTFWQAKAVTALCAYIEQEVPKFTLKAR